MGFAPDQVYFPLGKSLLLQFSFILLNNPITIVEYYSRFLVLIIIQSTFVFFFVKLFYVQGRKISNVRSKPEQHKGVRRSRETQEVSNQNLKYIRRTAQQITQQFAMSHSEHYGIPSQIYFQWRLSVNLWTEIMKEVILVLSFWKVV